MITIITILLGVFCSAMEALVTSTIMPTIIADLGGFALYPWVANSFMLASVVTAPFAGALADSFGYKKSYMGAVVIFLVGSLLCGMASSMTEMILFRVIQGIGSSALLTLSLVLFGTLFPIEKRAKMQALIGAMWALASICGPALGAFFATHFSWHWAFWINIPAGLIILLLFAFQVKIAEPSHKDFEMDLKGGLIFTLGTICLVYGLLNLGKFQFELINWAILAVALALLTYFFSFRPMPTRPFIPYQLFDKKSISLPVILAFFAGFFLFSVASFTPLLVQGVLGQEPMISGRVVMAVALGSFSGSLTSGMLLNRLGFRTMSTLGVLFTLMGFFILALQGPSALIWILMLGNFTVGCGVSMIANANMVAVQAASPPETLGSATSMVTFARTFGGMIGIALMGGLQLGLFHSHASGIVTENLSLLSSAQQLFDPVARHLIKPEDLIQVVEALSQSLQGVFIGCGTIALASLYFAIQMPNLSPKGVSEQDV